MPHTTTGGDWPAIRGYINEASVLITGSKTFLEYHGVDLQNYIEKSNAGVVKGPS